MPKEVEYKLQFSNKIRINEEDEELINDSVESGAYSSFEDGVKSFVTSNYHPFMEDNNIIIKSIK